MTPEEKYWIDNASYEKLLRKWRFAPVGDSFFTGETGSYYAEKMNQKRRELDPEEQVRISKDIYEVKWG